MILVFMYKEMIVFDIIIRIKWMLIIIEIVLSFWNFGGVMDICVVFMRVKIMREFEVVKYGFFMDYNKCIIKRVFIKFFWW